MKNICFILLFLLPFILEAQESIQTDRPDQTESVAITPKNFLQIESGLLYEKTGDNSESYSHPTVLWKYGINENFELRMVTEFNTERSENKNLSGLAPMTLGFKAKLAEEIKFLPAISFIGSLTLNKTGTQTFQTPYTAPAFRFLLQHTLSEKWSLGYNLGAEWNGESPDATGIYTLSAAYSLTEKLGAFAEFYGFLNKYQSADHRFDAGFTYLLNDNLQIDASSGLGISKISPDYFLSCGISYRFSTR
ncbi:transporter [Chryseobacterium sp.]|uniref:transporter n=1 Tax=Chryseobacterium sp. TaxID=1871047 RepID=UPI0016243194|nr:transporter [Chryseobacterium sp.]